MRALASISRPVKKWYTFLTARRQPCRCSWGPIRSSSTHHQGWYHRPRDIQTSQKPPRLCLEPPSGGDTNLGGGWRRTGLDRTDIHRSISIYWALPSLTHPTRIALPCRCVSSHRTCASSMRALASISRPVKNHHASVWNPPRAVIPTLVAWWFLTGLDIEAKARMLEAQVRRLLAPYSDRYTYLGGGWRRTGLDPMNSDTVDAAL
jgi:hypothetical protein